MKNVTLSGRYHPRLNLTANVMFSALAKAGDLVQKLELISIDCAPDKLGIMLRNMPGLKTLMIGGDSGIDHAHLDEIENACGGLEKFSLQLENAEGKALTNNIFHGHHLEAIGASGLLTSLELPGCQGLADEDVSDCLARNPDLETVSFGRCNQLTDAAFEDFEGDKLKVLNLNAVEGVTDETMVPIVERCGKLEWLGLAGSRITVGFCPCVLCLLSTDQTPSSIQDETINILGTSKPPLYSLHLNDCIALTPGALEALYPVLPHLISLRLSHLRLSDGVIRAIANSCPNLVQLSLCSSTGVNVESLLYLAFKLKGSLEMVNLDNVEAATQDTLKAFDAIIESDVVTSQYH